jgi:hypothetical protein
LVVVRFFFHHRLSFSSLVLICHLVALQISPIGPCSVFVFSVSLKNFPGCEQTRQPDCDRTVRSFRCRRLKFVFSRTACFSLKDSGARSGQVRFPQGRGFRQISAPSSFSRYQLPPVAVLFGRLLDFDSAAGPCEHWWVLVSGPACVLSLPPIFPASSSVLADFSRSSCLRFYLSEQQVLQLSPISAALGLLFVCHLNFWSGFLQVDSQSYS